MENPSLQSMLDQLESLSQNRKQVSFGNAVDVVGRHAFAPVLLLIGLIMMVPGPADIPGVPVVLGILVIIVSVQILIHRQHLWIPGWIENRHVSSKSLKKMASWLRRPARWLDRITKQRYSWLIRHAGAGIVAITCIIIAAATPVMEFVPFSANLAGLAIATFALAIIAKDGLVAAIAILLSISTAGLVAYSLIG